MVGCSGTEMRQILANLGAANVIVHRPYLPERFGVHHSKVGRYFLCEKTVKTM